MDNYKFFEVKGHEVFREQLVLICSQLDVFQCLKYVSPELDLNKVSQGIERGVVIIIIRRMRLVFDTDTIVDGEPNFANR